MDQESETKDPEDSGESGDPTILAEAVRCLGLAVLAPIRGVEVDAYESFEIVGKKPDWWEALLGKAVSIFERSPFLEDFVSGEAKDYWENSEIEGVCRSGMWEEAPGLSATGETGETGGNVPRFLEATASRTASGKPLLLIESADERLERERAYVQSVHELNLDQRRLQKELEKKQILLECITHDMGNPLAAVLLNLQHVARQVEGQPNLQTPIKRAIGQAKRQVSMVRSISEVFAADLATMREPNADGSDFPDLVAVAAKVLSDCAASATERSVTLCPIFRSPVHVVGNRLYLGRLIENLILNGIRHSPAGGAIMIGFEEKDGFAAFRVEDGGEGIDPEDIDLIFKPFAQGRVGERGETGLGLYFCRLTAEMWGGRIEVWNRPEGGACFEVWLPRVGATEGEIG